jgi:small-conductance mechanosensitive channel
MDQEPERRSRSRENMLAVALVVLVGGMMLFFLYIVSFGIVGNVLAGGCLLVLVCVMHYTVWGKSFSEEIAAEREALRRQDQQEVLPKPKPPPDAIQDLARVQGIQKK